eukprot:180367-Pelagomonas_calceolata.AAC.2
MSAAGPPVHPSHRDQYNPAPWNPVHNAQAIARIHRMGQSKPTFVYWLLYKNTAVRSSAEAGWHSGSERCTEQGKSVFIKNRPHAPWPQPGTCTSEEKVYKCNIAKEELFQRVSSIQCCMFLFFLARTSTHHQQTRQYMYNDYNEMLSGGSPTC